MAASIEIKPTKLELKKPEYIVQMKDCGLKSLFLMKEGGLNWLLFEILMREYHLRQFIEQSKNVEGLMILGGPDIYVPNNEALEEKTDFYKINPFLGLAKQYPKKVCLAIKKKNRENYHYIIHSYSNKIVLVEDFHKEKFNRGNTIVYEDHGLCEHLREDFVNTWNNEDEVFQWNGALDEIRNHLKVVPKEQLEKKF